MDLFIFEECVLFCVNTKWICIVSKLLAKMLTADIKQKFIHWATRGRLNNHCNSKNLLGIKRQRMVTGFLHTSEIQTLSAIFI